MCILSTENKNVDDSNPGTVKYDKSISEKKEFLCNLKGRTNMTKVLPSLKSIFSHFWTMKSMTCPGHKEHDLVDLGFF
jgi:hypothetical protein